MSVDIFQVELLLLSFLMHVYVLVYKALQIKFILCRTHKALFRGAFQRRNFVSESFDEGWLDWLGVLAEIFFKVKIWNWKDVGMLWGSLFYIWWIWTSKIVGCWQFNEIHSEI